MFNRFALFALLLSGCSCGSPSPMEDGGLGDGGSLDGALDAVDAPPPDPCEPNPCDQPNRGVCDSDSGEASCSCDAGFEEQAGECVPVSACDERTCSGRGTCRLEEAGPECDCELGASGRFCDECDGAAGYYDDGTGRCTQDACEPNPCEEPQRLLCEVVSERAVCRCNAGTHDEGGVCVADVTCTDTTCSGHGTCTEIADGTECACDTGFGGARCGECDEGYHPDGAGGCTMDVCLPNPCAEPLRSVCVDVDGFARCDCDPGTHLEGDGCVADEVSASDTESAR